MRSYPFTEVITDITAKFKKIKTSHYCSQGRYKIIDQGKESVAGYTDDASLVNGQLLPIIIFGDHTRILKYIDEPIALGADGAKALWVNPDLANTQYVYYYLRSIQIKEAGYSRHFKFLKEIVIPIPFKDGKPNFDDQIRIALLLGKVERLITQRKQHLQQLDDLFKSVFLEMFGDPVRNEKGWDKPELQAFGKILTGNTPSRKESANYDSDFIEWIKTDNIKSDAIFVSPATEHLSEVGVRKARTITTGALLVACIAGSIESIGRAALTDRTVSFNQQINAIQPGKDVNPLYLYGLFKLSRTYIQKHATKGMKKILTKGDFEKITMIKPPLEVQNQFAFIVEKVEIIKSKYQQSLTDLEALYGALSQQAFKGELDLSRIEPLTQQIIQCSMEEQSLMPTPNIVEIPAIELPKTDFLIFALNSRDNLQQLLRYWLEAYIAQLGETALSIESFIAAAQTRLAEFHPDNEFELGTDDYEYIKSWVFEALSAGKLKQIFNDVDNSMHLKVM